MSTTSNVRVPIYRQLYFWVLVAIGIGGGVGSLWPAVGIHGKHFADGFLALIKMLIGPVIFLTVTLGISASSDVKKVGRTGVKAILYFETVSNIALLIGVVVANLFQPGRGVRVDPATLTEAPKVANETLASFFLGLIPKTFVSAFTSDGSLLQILLLGLLFGYALNHAGEHREKVRGGLQGLSKVFMKMVEMIMWLAPLGAGGAIAFTAAKYGASSLGPLLKFVALFYLTCIVFVVAGLGLIARWTGFSIFSFLRYIREELFTVFATSSSESAIVPLMNKLEKLGCSKTTVGLVVPAGYSFNLDGTNIYITLGILFIAQAMGIDLSFAQQASIFLVGVFTSQGASGVTGAGLVTLTATMAAVPEVPIAGVALILGVDRFMSEARALTNFVGNGVAAIVVSKWEKDLDYAQLKKTLG